MRRVIRDDWGMMNGELVCAFVMRRDARLNEVGEKKL